jgi:tRNA threonylcarbamoyladenosine biosynthesis protein TsaB
MNELRRLLALETAGPVASVAIAEDGRVLARHFLEEPRTHAAGLIPAIERVLAASGTGRDELTAVAVGAGPGSFTGVRVAAATAKGLCHALALPLFAPSSLLGAALTEVAAETFVGVEPPEGAALEPAPPIGLRVVLFDARGERLFLAAYRLGTGLPEVVVEPTFAELGDVVEDARFRGAAFCGDGALRHARAIGASGGHVLAPPTGFPSADGLVRALALDDAPEPVEDPRRWEPTYLRDTGAVRARRSVAG